jgi:hypothetical protein
LNDDCRAEPRRTGIARVVINPVRYKDVNRPADAEPLGNLLGLTVLRGVRQIKTQSAAPLAIQQQTISLPRTADFTQRIAAVAAEQTRLMRSLKRTNINCVVAPEWQRGFETTALEMLRKL